MPQASDGREEAREFLAGFLIQMQASERTQSRVAQSLQMIVQQNQTLIAQNQTLIGHLGMVSAQLDGLAQRSDLLEQQLSMLCAVISDDGRMITHQRVPVRPRGPRHVGVGINSNFGQALGNMVSVGFEHMMQGGGGGQRP